MRIWNLSSFEDVAPTVMASPDSETSATFRGVRSRATARKVSLSALSTMVVVAAISVSPMQVNVVGNDTKLHVEAIASMANFETDRPPLEVLFGADHPLKWDKAKEQAMLEKAAGNLTGERADRTAENIVQSLLREKLPADRDHSADLAGLGIKLS
jgi:hypothetical protein